MKLRDRFLLATRAAFGIFSNDAIASQFVSFLFPDSSSTPPKRGTREILRAYSTHPWLRAVSAKIARSVASAEWVLFATGEARSERQLDRNWFRDSRLQRSMHQEYRDRRLQMHKQDGTLVDIEEHPLLDSLTGGNIFLTGNAVWTVSSVHHDLAGEVFWLKQRPTPTSPPDSYFPLPPWWIKKTPTPKDPTYIVQFPNQAGAEAIPETEILWIVDPDVEKPYGRGSGLAFSLGDELDTSEFASKHVKQFFFNSAKPPILITGKGLKDETVRKRMSQEWTQRHGGFLRSWKPAFLSDEVTVKELGQSFNDMNLLELMKHSRDVFVHVFGVPPEIFGILENSNRATIEAAEFLFTKHVIMPRLEMWRSWLQTCLVPEFDERLILDFVTPVQADKVHTLNVMKAAPWAFRVDEWRVEGGQEELPDGDGDVFLVPLRLIPVSAPQESGNMAPAQIEEPTEEAQRLLPPGKGNGVVAVRRFDQLGVDRLAAIPPNGKGRFTDANADDPFWAIIHRIADRLEPEVRRGFVSSVESFAATIDESQLARILAGRGPAGIDDLPWQELERLLQEAIGDTLARTVGASMEVGSEQLSSVLGVSFEANLDSTRAQAFIREFTGDLIREVTDETRIAVREFVSEAFAEGQTIPQTAAKVKTKVGLTRRQIATVERFENKLREQGVSEAVIRRRVAAQERAQLRRRALNISRTETIRASNMGQQLVWEQAATEGFLDPTTARRRWIVTPDDRLDTRICEPMEGQQVLLNEPFQTPVGASVLTPPAHPQCRCAVSLEFVDQRGITHTIVPIWIVQLASEAKGLELGEEIAVAA